MDAAVITYSRVSRKLQMQAEPIYKLSHLHQVLYGTFAGSWVTVAQRLSAKILRVRAIANGFSRELQVLPKLRIAGHELPSIFSKPLSRQLQVLREFCIVSYELPVSFD